MQFGTSTCNPQPCIVERSGYSCYSDLPIERKVMQYQILLLKSKGLGWKKWKVTKLENYCKGGKENINSKGFK